MFTSDEVRAEASPVAAAARLAALACGSSLTRASHAAWDTATAAVGHPGPGPGLARLTQVHCRGPVQRGPVAMLILRWEAAAGNGLPFPALDADITLVPDGDHAVLVGLAGVYRPPPGTRPGHPDVHTAAAAAIRALLSRIASAISDPPSSGTATSGTVPALVTLACASPASL